VIPRKRLADLLGRPGRRGMLCRDSHTQRKRSSRVRRTRGRRDRSNTRSW
jgi:hypothetical protein